MASASPVINGFDSPDFHLDPPAQSINITPQRVTIRAHPKTDYWRIPHSEQEEAANRHNGAFYGVPIDSERSFEAGAWIQGKWGVQYDQGCVMVIAGEGDGRDSSWMKAGVEVDGGKQWIGAVVSSLWSDWSVGLASKNTSQLSRDPFWLFIRVVRFGPTLRIYHMFAPQPTDVPDASPDLVMIREVKGFDEENRGAEGGGRNRWRIGVMVCGPKNEEGTEATFEGFYVKYL